MRAFNANIETNKGVALISDFIESKQPALRTQEIGSAVKGGKSVKSNLVAKS